MKGKTATGGRCQSCHEPLEPGESCPVCRKLTRPRCSECHGELAHGTFPPSVSAQVVIDDAEAVDRQHGFH